MTGPRLKVRVECFENSGPESQTPTPILQRFFLGERVIEVAEVQDRWLDPKHRYFKVQGDDGHVYILRHDVDSDRWELTFFDRSTENQTGDQ